MTTPSSLYSLSVILCAYTELRWDDLLAAVLSVQQQALPAHEIIVVVDHNPQLFDRARKQWREVIVVENHEARGLSGARNSGVAATTGNTIVFLDDDAVAAPDWLQCLVSAYADPQVLGTGGAINPRWPGARPVWFPAEFHWVVGCTYRGMPEEPMPVRNLIGCNMSFRRNIFDTVGGFRIGRVGTLSMGQENDETEFCIRLAAHYPAAQLLYQPAARVEHNVTPGRTTLSYFVRRCFSEGLSKATLTRQVGQSQGLSSERSYTLHTLPQGVLRGIGDALFRRDLAGLLRAGVISIGFGVTAAGYLFGMLTRRKNISASVAKPVQSHV